MVSDVLNDGSLYRMELDDAADYAAYYSAENFAFALYGRYTWRGPTRAQKIAILHAMNSLARKYPDKIGVSGGKGGRDQLIIYLLRNRLAPWELSPED